MGSRVMDTVPAGIFISRQEALSARLRCVSITPLLLPVVPEVNKMAHSLSGSSSQEKLPAWFFRRTSRDFACSVSSFACMETMHLISGHFSPASSATSLRSSS